MKINLVVTISFLLFFSGFAAAAATDIAATVMVTKISDTSDGVCDADCSLREAVIAVNNGDTIVFSSLFNQPQTITLTGGQISISKSLTIAGPSADLLTVDANERSRIFNISNNVVVALSGMRLWKGRAEIAGGAILLTDGTLTLTNMTLNNNRAGSPITGSPNDYGNGGAVFSSNSALSVVNSIIDNNSSIYGGGIYSERGIGNITGSRMRGNEGAAVVSRYGDVINISNSTFSGNNGGAVIGSYSRVSVINSTVVNNGSGISNSEGTLTINRSTISDSDNGSGIYNNGTATVTKTTINNNDTSSKYGNIGGAGIYNSGNMTVNDSTISNNKANRFVGGIRNSGQLTLTNSTVSGNGGSFYNSPFGFGSGGGIYNTNIGKLILTNSTITYNTSFVHGGGLCHDSSGTVTVRNTIISGNVAGSPFADVAGAVVSQGFNLIGNTTGSFGWTDSDLLNRNPLLVPLGYNGGLTLTHALMPTSPAINAGNSDLAVDPATNLRLTTDQRGYGRYGFGSNTVDIGAFESGGSLSLVRLGGRVLTPAGRGIFNARIVLTDSNGTVLQARTNPFGYYRFVNVPPGITYTFTVIHKHYKFSSPQTITIDNDRIDLNFIASL
jgi:CSLREA domain-containing protein